MEKEIWKDIPGYEGYYQVSSIGRVRSLDRTVDRINVYTKKPHKFRIKGRVLSPAKCGVKQYLTVSISKNDKTKKFSVHQLVAMAFLGHNPCGMKLVVDHIDNNPHNNNVSNLQTLTQRDNMIKNPYGSSKYIGVSWNKFSGKWSASISIDNRKVHLGYFENEQTAAESYKKALEKLEKEK